MRVASDKTDPTQQTLSTAGWQLVIGSATRVASAPSPDYCAIYDGRDFGAPQRGMLVALSHSPADRRLAADIAQGTLHGFAEGYFGQPLLLGRGVAAGRALLSMNAWVFGQARNSGQPEGLVASLSALAFGPSRQIGFVHVGGCRIYVRRNGITTLVSAEHVRSSAAGAVTLTRALGADSKLVADYSEQAAKPSDRMVLLSEPLKSRLPLERVHEILSLDLPAGPSAERLVAEAATLTPGGPATALVVDVVCLPEPAFDDVASTYANLPLRPPPHEGEILDDFMVGRTLYRSRYTLLKRARDRTSGADVVLKLPLPAMLHDEVFRAGFVREAWIGATVRSRWVATYIDPPPERRRSLYLVMPFYRGVTLEERLSRRERIGFAEGLGISLQLCRAVTDLMALQVIHRDLKPENIIIEPGGDIRLIDLGLAYLPGIDSSDAETLGGTTSYMAPELFKGTQPNPRTEVFSIGVTMYRMFSGGKFPFGQHQAYPLARLRPDMPAWVGKVIQSAIAQDPAARFSDAGVLAAALERGLLHGEAPPPAAPFGISEVLALRLTALALALALFAVLVVNLR